MIKTEIGYTTPETISVRGLNLATEIIGKLDFVEMLMLVQTGRLPSEREKAMVNAILVTGTDHGLTPSAIAARLTYLGAPEALQGAVAAGLLGAGSVLLGVPQNVAEMLIDAARTLSDATDDATLLDAARALIDSRRQLRQPVYGLGHPIHINGDPRVPALREVSRLNGFYGLHWRLLDAIAQVLMQERGKNLPLNAAGAVGAMVADMGFDPLMGGRGLGLIGRCAGLVAHIAEERSAPTGQQVWNLVLSQDSRNVLPDAVARKADP